MKSIIRAIAKIYRRLRYLRTFRRPGRLSKAELSRLETYYSNKP